MSARTEPLSLPDREQLPQQTPDAGSLDVGRHPRHVAIDEAGPSEQRSMQKLVLAVVVDRELDERTQAARDRARGRRAARGALDEPLERGLDHRHVDGLLRFEVQVEAALAGAGVGRDVVDGRSLVAEAAELGLGRGDQASVRSRRVAIRSSGGPRDRADHPRRAR